MIAPLPGKPLWMWKFLGQAFCHKGVNAFARTEGEIPL